MIKFYWQMVTGALDSSTSGLIMDLKVRTVMVTNHKVNSHQYATRIVELADGPDSSDPFDIYQSVVRQKARETFS